MLLTKFSELREVDFVKLFNHDFCKTENIVGYCKCSTHNGYISKNLAKSHDCFKKQCRHLVKFQHDFWEIQGLEYEAALSMRERGKAHRKRERAEFISKLINESQSLVKVVDVKEFREPFAIIVVYDPLTIYAKGELDLTCFVETIKLKYGCAVTYEKLLTA